MQWWANTLSVVGHLNGPPVCYLKYALTYQEGLIDMTWNFIVLQVTVGGG